MENNILSKKLTEMIHALGNEIKNDPRAAALKEAAAAYNGSSELNRLINEYNVHQTALSAEYAKEDKENEVISSIENRINELYDEITGCSAYADYIRAKEEYDAFYGEICSELEFAVTGNRPCSHNCDSCGGCHH